MNRADSKAYHKRTLTVGPSSLSVPCNYMHVPRPLQLAARTHSATHNTVPPAAPTQSADSGRIGTEVRRFLILQLYVRLRVVT